MQEFQCPLHREPINYICMEEDCAKSRIFCSKCVREKHPRHKIFLIDKIAYPLNSLNCNSLCQNAQRYTHQLTEAYNSLNNELAQLPTLLFRMRPYFIEKMTSQFTALASSFSDTELDLVYRKIKSGELNESDLESLLQKMKFLEQNSLGSPEKILKICNIIKTKGIHKIKDALHVIREVVEDLKRFFEFYNFNNADGIEESQARLAGDFSKERNEEKELNSQRVPYFGQPSNSEQNLGVPEKRRQLNPSKPVENEDKGIDLQQFENEGIRMIDQLFEKNKIHDENPLMHYTFAESSEKTSGVDPVKIEGEASGSMSNIPSYENFNSDRMRFAHNIPTGKKLEKKTILQAIKNFPANTKEYCIVGDNEFDTDCLKEIIKYHPTLKKLNYMWNFEQDGLKLQEVQTFMEDIPFMDKRLPASPELFRLYGELSELENLHIERIDLFNKEIKIRNKKIKHLTIGQYVTEYGVSQKQIGEHLLQEILNIGNLKTLNFFNIKKLEHEKILLKKNSETLESIWITQCNDISLGFLIAISRLPKLKCLIFDCCHTPKFNLSVPPSLHTLIIDNCKFLQSDADALRNLDKCSNLKNFSISDTKFRERINNNVIKDLVAGSPSLQYLNINDCKGIDSGCIEELRKLKDLKRLSLEETRISLKNFIKQVKENDMPGLQKLGVCGLDDFSQEDYLKIAQKISKRFPKLKYISLNFKDGLEKLNFNERFKSIQIFNAIKLEGCSNQTKKNLTSLRKILTKRGIKYFKHDQAK